jgi:hypothetical protein
MLQTPNNHQNNKHEQDFRFFNELVLRLPEKERDADWEIAHQKGIPFAVTVLERICPKTYNAASC